MGLFGKKYLIEHPEKYEKEEREIIALAETDPTGSHIPSDKYWRASLHLIACVDCETGELMENPRYLTWNFEDGKNKNAHGIKMHGIYRLRVLYSLPSDAGYGEIPAGRSLFVTKVVKKNVSEPRLEEILAEYKKPVIIETAAGDKLTLDRSHGAYSGSIKWGDDDIEVRLDVDDGCDICDTAMKTFEALCSESEAWVQKAKLFLAKEFTENANDWQEGEEGYTYITEADFAEKITLCLISICDDGSMEFWFDDGEMFFGHTLVAFGTVEEGFTEGNMMG